MLPAPQIELPDRPIRSYDEPYPLAGWGTVAKHWAIRHDRSGTFDQAWMDERHPLLPLDFDPRYWNGAHPDLQLERLPEDAVIELYGMIPSSRAHHQALRVQLPGLRAFVGVIDTDEPEPLKLVMPMDTVQIDLPENELSLLYRLNLPSPPTLGTLYVGIEEAA